MSIKKRIISVFTALATATVSLISFSGCSSDISYAMEVDGEKIAAGLYILYSGQALNDAQIKFREDNPDTDTTKEGFDYYDQTVSEMSFGDYVKQETLNYCKRHIAVNRLFDELEIPIKEDDSKNLNDSINSQWDYDVSNWNSTLKYLKNFKTLGAYYESIGVSKSSLKEFMTNSFKASKIFTYYYGEGGIEEVPKSDKEKWLDENYSLARYFGISITDSDGKVLESKTQLAILENLAKEYVEKLNKGDAFKDVYNEYKEYQKAQTSTSANSGTAEATTDPDTVTSAEERARAADDGDETTVITAAPEETQPEEITGTTAPEEKPEETAEQTGEATGDTTTPGMTQTAPAQTKEETSAPEGTTGETGTGTTTTEVKDSDYDRIINKDSTSPSKEFVKSLFEQEKNTAVLFKADTFYYVVQKLDILTSEEDYVKKYNDNALQGLRSDDMDAIFEKKYADYSVDENKSAPDYCAQQADNAANGLTTVSQIQYLAYYYSQMFGGGM